ncbi:hypothetical protein [Rhodospirillum sp. A1_3_36]|uniref:hypothetical protein n=1 Tax=Rhodospirillum sp. A1_3_36 TaxID=3391666 RepID=UPI0039A7255C
MSDQTALTLYCMVRDNPDLWAELNRITDREEFCSAIVQAGMKQGLAIELDTVRQMTSEDFIALIRSANDDKELTDEELELCAAGWPVRSVDGDV